MLCLRDFELYSRWVPLKFAYTVRAVHTKKKVIGYISNKNMPISTVLILITFNNAMFKGF